MTFEQEVDEAIRRLNGLVPKLKVDRKYFLRHAAEPLVDAIKSYAPVGNKVHKTYLKGVKGVRGTYHPGNLRASIQILDLKKSDDVFVGPLVSKSGQGQFGPQRPNAYYANMVEYGVLGGKRKQPYMRPGWAAAKPIVLARIKKSVELLVIAYAQKYNGK